MRILAVRKLKPTTYAALIGIAGGVLIGLSLAGIASGSAALLGSLLLGLPLAAYIYLTLTVAELGRRLRVSRIIAGSPVEGYAAPVRVVVESTSPLVSGSFEVLDRPPEDVPLLTEPRGRGLLLPYGKIEMIYFLAPRIGSRSFGPAVIRVQDPLGFYEAIVEVEPEGDLAVHGLPSRALMEKSMRLMELEDPYTVPRARLVKREGTEIYSIREFVEGDEPRLIDWKATARLGKLYVKELRRETYIPVLFVFAPGPGSMEGEPFRTPLERLARAVAALGQDVISRDGTAGLMIVSGTRVVLEPPVKASEGLSRLIRLLATMPLPREPPRGVLNRVIEYLRRHSPGRTIIVVATDTGSLPAIWREMNVLAEKKLSVLYLVAGPGEPPRLVPHEKASRLAETRETGVEAQ